MFWQEVVVVIALLYAKIITWKPRVFPLHHSTFALGYREKYIDRERMISYPGWYFEREQYHNIIWIKLNALTLTWHLSGQPIFYLTSIERLSYNWERTWIKKLLFFSKVVVAFVIGVNNSLCSRLIIFKFPCELSGGVQWLSISRAQKYSNT